MRHCSFDAIDLFGENEGECQVYSGGEIGRKVVDFAAALRNSSGRIWFNLCLYQLDFVKVV